MKANRFNHFVPVKLDNILRYLRYLVLAWVLYMTAASGTLIFAEFDPYFALFNFWSDEVALSGLVILGVALVSVWWRAVFGRRPQPPT